jgi:hypothetical protein
MSKTVTFDFWQIEMPPNLGSFSDLLERAALVQPLAARVKTVGDRTLRLETIRRHERLFTGDILKLRMDELPGVASLSTPRQDLPLNVDQGITEETAFAFDPQNNCLITQRNFYGASATVITGYLCELANFQGVVTCNAIVSDAGFTRLESMPTVKKLIFKVARPRNGTIGRARETSVGQAIQMLDDVGAMQVEMTMSVGRFNSSLNRTKVLAMVRELIGLRQADGETVEKVLITGRDENDERDMFDLLEYRVLSIQEIPIDPARRTMTSDSRMNAAIRAFRDRGVQITAILQ